MPRSPPPPPPQLNSVGHLQVMLRNEAAAAAARLLVVVAAAAADNALGFSVIRPLRRRSTLVQARLKLPGFGSHCIATLGIWRTDRTPDTRGAAHESDILGVGPQLPSIYSHFISRAPHTMAVHNRRRRRRPRSSECREGDETRRGCREKRKTSIPSGQPKTMRE